LLTTRVGVLGPLAQTIELKSMTPEVGTLFLLRRAGRIPLDSSLEDLQSNDRTIAMEIVQELGGLPLALDQAGAYLEETRCSLSNYLSLYRRERFRLLQRRGILTKYAHHPEPVATTWSISFRRLDPPATELLSLCAFLYSDAIPEIIFTQGASQLSSHLQVIARDPLAFDEVVKSLLAYSLINRDGDNNTLRIHRLVQAALQQEMDQESFQLWAKRALTAVNEVFPSHIDFTTWMRCEQLLSNALACILIIQQIRIESQETVQLLIKTGMYLHDRGQYTEAESSFQVALTIQEKRLDFGQQDTAWIKVNLAMLYHEMGRYSEAKSLLFQALEIQERILEPDHPVIAMSKTELAWIYLAQGEYRNAETSFLQALRIRQQSLGLEHIDTATSMTNLAWIYCVQGKYAEAEPLYLQALAIHQQKAGIKHPLTAQVQNNLGLLYSEQKKYTEAEKLLLEAIATREQWMGPEYTGLAVSIANLVHLYYLQGRLEDAAHLYRQALKIQRQRLGPEHPHTAETMIALGNLYRLLGKLEDAEHLILQSLNILEQRFGRQNINTAKSIGALAKLYAAKGLFKESEELFQQVLKIYERHVLPTQYEKIETLRDYAVLLRTMNRNIEAQAIEERIPSKQ
jgi:tetratricopeptide (TPR) repeat protein